MTDTLNPETVASTPAPEKEPVDRKEYNRKYSKAARQKRREAGLCTYCKTPAMEGKSMCEVHAEANRTRAKERRVAKKAAASASVSNAEPEQESSPCPSPNPAETGVELPYPY